MLPPSGGDNIFHTAVRNRDYIAALNRELYTQVPAENGAAPPSTMGLLNSCFITGEGVNTFCSLHTVVFGTALDVIIKSNTKCQRREWRMWDMGSPRITEKRKQGPNAKGIWQVSEIICCATDTDKKHMSFNVSFSPRAMESAFLLCCLHFISRHKSGLLCVTRAPFALTVSEDVPEGSAVSHGDLFNVQHMKKTGYKSTL